MLRAEYGRNGYDDINQPLILGHGRIKRNREYHVEWVSGSSLGKGKQRIEAQDISHIDGSSSRSPIAPKSIVPGDHTSKWISDNKKSSDGESSGQSQEQNDECWSRTTKATMGNPNIFE